MFRLFAVTLLATLLLTGCNTDPASGGEDAAVSNEKSPPTEAVEAPGGWEKKQVVMHVDFGKGIIDPIESYGPLRWQKGMTVIDAMQAWRKFGLEYEAEEKAGIGTFIKGFRGVANDPDNGIYWMLCINDTSSAEGAAARVLKPGDVINWWRVKPKELGCVKIGAE